MGLFDLFEEDSRRQLAREKKDSSFDWPKVGYRDPIKPKKNAPMYKDLESYSCDEEAEEDGFFDENP